jgi:RNA polymerase primary sigma factor
MRTVIAKRFGLDGQPPQTLEQVGAELGVTRERVRQLESRALRELRSQAPQLYLYLRSA